MELKLNMNEKVRVKLSKFGVKLLEEERDKRLAWEEDSKGKEYIKKEYSVDEKGYCNLQIYKIMKIFGEYADSRNADKKPFEDFTLLRKKD